MRDLSTFRHPIKPTRNSLFHRHAHVSPTDFIPGKYIKSILLVSVSFSVGGAGKPFDKRHVCARWWCSQPCSAQWQHWSQYLNATTASTAHDCEYAGGAYADHAWSLGAAAGAGLAAEPQSNCESEFPFYVWFFSFVCVCVWVRVWMTGVCFDPAGLEGSYGCFRRCLQKTYSISIYFPSPPFHRGVSRQFPTRSEARIEELRSERLQRQSTCGEQLN